MRPLPLFLLLGLAAVPGTARAQDDAPRHGCATPVLMERRLNPAAAGIGAASVQSLSTRLSGRTLFTPHFAIHYTLGRNVHQPKWLPADAGLKASRDSLLTALSAVDAIRRDSMMHAALDSMGAPHPAYIVRAGQYFESAYAYYGDTLHMRMPDSNSSDNYARPSRGRFSVDVGDLEVMGSLHGAYYGLTWPPTRAIATGQKVDHSAIIYLENDFLYDAIVNINTGAITGRPVTASFNGSILHDYSTDAGWDLGLAVTIAHEYYHAVQFEYTPNPSGYHAWYELSAVGMEERLAGHVNDYLQYLRFVIPRTGTVSLLTPPQSDENYGNAIFHIYLSRVLGKSFDVSVWQYLRDHGNALPAALLNMAGSQAGWDSLYTAFAASVALAGRPGSETSPLAFSPDFALWPKPTFDSVPVPAGATFTLAPMTFRLVAPSSAGLAWASFSGTAGLYRVDQNGSTYSRRFFPDSIVALAPENGAFALSVANSSFTGNRLLKLATQTSPGIAAFPNPASRATTVLFFSAGAPTTAVLSVFSESGRRVATLTPGASGTYWVWNIRQAQDPALPAGVYFFGIPGEAPRTLLVLP